jgi:2-carboxy-1,4-naphthoquinone phytyltransferase
VALDLFGSESTSSSLVLKNLHLILNVMAVVSAIEQPKFKLWLAAIKPPMYTVAIIPITVGSVVAYSQTRSLNLTILGTFLGSAIAIIAWLNISNDVFDSDTGIDINKAESVVNLTGNRQLMFWVGNFCLLLGITGIGMISWWQQDITVVVVISIACFLGYTYQGPPFRLGYKGLGEVICTICFGPLALGAAYYSQAQSWSIANLVASLIIGISTSLILFCSHFHQVKDDLAAGKLSPIVRMGTKMGSQVLQWATASIYILTVVGVVIDLFPVATLLVFVSLPLALKLTKFVSEYYDRPDRVRTCKYLAVRLHFVSGLLLALGFYLPH